MRAPPRGITRLNSSREPLLRLYDQNPQIHNPHNMVGLLLPAAIVAVVVAATVQQPLLGRNVTVYNNSDCCCGNIYPRSSQNLVRTSRECAANCAADSKCAAAIMISEPPSDVQHQCQLPRPAPLGHGCCIHKPHFDSLSRQRNPAVSSTVIDMGTTNGPCPSRPPPAPPPPPRPSPTPPEGSCFGECRRPWYHYTAPNLITSDPNGLQWRRGASGKIIYEFFHQDRNSYVKTHPQYCWGSEGEGNAWGHASSPDLLHWHSMPVSGICASSGGALLPVLHRPSATLTCTMQQLRVCRWGHAAC